MGRQFSRNKKQVLGPVSAILALLFFSAGTANAATGSWSNQPSWATGTPPSAAAKSTARRATIQRESTPTPFAPDSNNLSLDVGQVFLMGDLSTSYNDSLGMQLHYTYGVSEMFGFDASVGHSSHSGGRYSLTTLLAGLRTNLTWYDKVIPYAVFGLGFYKPGYKFDDLTSYSPVVFGLHLGPGVTLQLTDQFFFGASLTFHDIFGSRQETSKGIVEVDGTYTSFFLNAGFTF